MKSTMMLSLLVISMLGCATATTAQPIHKTVEPFPTRWERPSNSDYRIVQVFVSEELPFNYKMAVVEAVEEWDMSLNGHMNLLVVPFLPKDELALKVLEQDNDIVIRGAHSNDPFILKSQNAGAAACTYPWGTHLPSAIIYLNLDRLLPQNARNTMVHELGHSFGANDNDYDSPKTLMSRVYSGVSCVDRDAAEQVAHAFRWDVETIKYCKGD